MDIFSFQTCLIFLSTLYSACFSPSFLDLWFYIFHWFWTIFGYYYISYFLCSILSFFLLLLFQLWMCHFFLNCPIAPESVLIFFSFLHFSLRIFYWSIFKLIDSFHSDVQNHKPMKGIFHSLSQINKQTSVILKHPLRE